MTDTPPGTVTVANVKPATVTTAVAWRILFGRFISRFVEAFAGAAAMVTLFMPSNAQDWQKLGALLIGPFFVALYQAGRGAWPAIKKWLDSGGEVAPDLGP